MKRLLIGSAWIITSLLYIGEAVAQRANYQKEKQYWKHWQKVRSPFRVYTSIGPTLFLGELYRSNIGYQGEVGLAIDYWKKAPISIGLEYNRGLLRGRENEFFNDYFQSKFQSISILQYWNVRGESAEDDYPWQWEIIAGAGLLLFTANAYNTNTNELIRFTNHADNSTHTTHFQKWGKSISEPGIRYTRELILPVGVRAGYQLNRNWRLQTTVRYNWVRTDKLDATSGYHKRNPEEADSYSDTPNDSFITTTLGVSYRFLTNRK